MYEAVLSGLIGGISMALIGHAVAKRPPRVASSGRTIATYSPVLQIIAVATTLILAAGTVVTIFRQPGDHDVHVLLFAATVLGGGYMLLEFFLVRIEFDDTNLYAFAPWRKPREIPWASITRVSYSATMMWHVLHTREQQRVRIPDWLNGSATIAARAREHAGS